MKTKISKVIAIVSLLITLATSMAGVLEEITPKYAVLILAITGVISAFTKAVQDKVLPILEDDEATATEGPVA